MMRRCQDGTAAQYLTAHWTPVSETVSRQHLRSAASHQLTFQFRHISGSHMVVGRSLSPVRRRATHCRNVYATLPAVLLLLAVFSKHFSSRSTNVPSVLWRCWLGGRKGIRPVKKLSGRVLAWLSVCSEVHTCMWPSGFHCHSLSLASLKSRLVLPFWYRLIRVVLDKGPLNGCVCVRAVLDWLLFSEVIVFSACGVCAFRVVNLLFCRCLCQEYLVESNIQFTIFS